MFNQTQKLINYSHYYSDQQILHLSNNAGCCSPYISDTNRFTFAKQLH